MELAAFAEAVRTYATLMGASATSWGRTTQHNKAVGGVMYSAHRFWMGTDLVYDEPKPLEERQTTAMRLGLKLIIENDHDHVQPADWVAG